MVKIDKNLAAGETFTVPADGIYCLGFINKSQEMNAWWMIGDARLCGGYAAANCELTMLAPLKKGTVLSTREVSGASYFVMHYFAI